jgi:hypothetical protein
MNERNEKTARQKTASEKGDKSGNRPVHEVRLGRVKATVWANQSENGLWYSVQVGRLYKDAEQQQWKIADGFHRDDLPLVMKVADRVHTWLYENAGSAARASAAGRGESIEATDDVREDDFPW